MRQGTLKMGGNDRVRGRDGGKVVSIYPVGGRPRLIVTTEIQASTPIALVEEP